MLNGALENWGEEAKEELKTPDEKANNLEELFADSSLQPQDSGGKYLTE